MRAAGEDKFESHTFSPARRVHPGKEQLVKMYKMQQHPEGGHYVETFRSNVTVNTPIGERSASTAILFLLGHNEASNLHRIKSEEVWHYYAGGPIAIFELVEDTQSFKVTQLGPDIENNQKLQHMVPANVWFGAYVDHPDAEYSLVGCTVAPGFDFQDFELGERNKLLEDFPAAMDVINRLTRNETDLGKIMENKGK